MYIISVYTNIDAHQSPPATDMHCALSHTATLCNTLQYPAIRYHTLPHTATPCSTLHCLMQHTALSHTLQRTATQCHTLQRLVSSHVPAPHATTQQPTNPTYHPATQYTTSPTQHSATHCNTLQRHSSPRTTCAICTMLWLTQHSNTPVHSTTHSFNENSRVRCDIAIIVIRLILRDMTASRVCHDSFIRVP